MGTFANVTAKDPVLFAKMRAELAEIESALEVGNLPDASGALEDLLADLSGISDFLEMVTEGN